MSELVREVESLPTRRVAEQTTHLVYPGKALSHDPLSAGLLIVNNIYRESITPRSIRFTKRLNKQYLTIALLSILRDNT